MNKYFLIENSQIVSTGNTYLELLKNLRNTKTIKTYSNDYCYVYINRNYWVNPHRLGKYSIYNPVNVDTHINGFKPDELEKEIAKDTINYLTNNLNLVLCIKV